MEVLKETTPQERSNGGARHPLLDGHRESGVNAATCRVLIIRVGCVRRARRGKAAPHRETLFSTTNK